MERYESNLGSEWSALNAMHSTEESDFMGQLLINYCSIPNEVEHFPGGTHFYSYYAGEFDHIYDDFVVCNENMMMQLEQEDQVPDSESNKDVEFSNPLQKSKKRSTSSGDKRNVKAKKKQKHTKTSCRNNKKQNGLLEKQSSSSCSSENDSIASHELNGVALSFSESKEADRTINSNGLPRAVRGSATDPQSLYARKRRERINERLRRLQKLVPNGTKVDISTMLEDAVEYVKFLQLQIKLLSSDDKWMYAPIAYNGTDVRT